MGPARQRFGRLAISPMNSAQAVWGPLCVPESAIVGAGLLGGEGSEPVERREVDHAHCLVDVAAAVLDAVEGVVEHIRTSWSRKRMSEAK